MALSSSAATLAVDAALAGVTHVQLHSGEPGGSGTANVITAVDATRQAVTLGAGSGGVVAATTNPEWEASAGFTIEAVTLWTASSGGTFKATARPASPVPVALGATVILRTLSITVTAEA
jgi:hypothetical protein